MSEVWFRSDSVEVCCMNYSDHGIPILSMSEKLEALKEMIEEEAYDDAAGHLCDLLEFCRSKIITDDGMIFANLQSMVKYYGKHPTPIENQRRKN